MSTIDYARVHERQYQWLRANGFHGWGGETLERRMKGWQDTLATLFGSAEFPRPGARVLELGSGAGDSLFPVAEKGYLVHGIEVSPSAVTWAHEKAAALDLQIDFRVGSLADPLPFETDHFDAILDAACLHCLIGADRKTAFSEAARVLRPGGFFLVSHMSGEPREMEDGMTFDSSTRTLIKHGMAYRTIPSIDDLRSEVERSGLKIVRENVRHNPWWDHAELWCLKG